MPVQTCIVVARTCFSGRIGARNMNRLLPYHGNRNIATAVRGMKDLLPPELSVMRQIVGQFERTVGAAGFQQMATPLIEHTPVFARSLGDDSDVVMKEMYTFPSPRGGGGADELLLTLRPEGTAGLMRAVLASPLGQALPQRLAYSGPMFRHERPQRGRYRQFHQVGVEHVGAGDAHSDAEALSLAALFLERVIDGNKYELELKVNSLGDVGCMRAYAAALTAYLSDKTGALSLDSQERLKRHAVLRILDSKDKGDGEVLSHAPSIAEYWGAESRARFERVLTTLTALNLPYTVDHRLVRGLDYYRHTVFEFIAREKRSSGGGATATGGVGGATATGGVVQAVGPVGTVLAGGRYDDLSLALGHHKAVPAIGWAAGLERLQLMTHLTPLETSPTIALLPLACATATASASDAHLACAVEDACASLAHALRRDGVTVVSQHGYKHVKKALAFASRTRASFALLVGENEHAAGVVLLKHMASGRQVTVGACASHALSAVEVVKAMERLAASAPAIATL